MKHTGLVLTLLFSAALLFPALAFADAMQYAHAGKGFTLGISRGITLRNDELEATGTKEFVLGVELSPDVLQLRIPFGSYEVDTRGKILPRGRVRAKSVGAALWLGFGGESWTPFVGAGGNFYSFQEQFMSMGNLESEFGAELYAGVRFRLVKSLWDYAKLRGAVYYQGTFLRPGVQSPDHPDKTRISMHRHSIVLMLEAVGL